MKSNIKNVIAFCILMENDKGILGKSFDYIVEKFERLIENEISNPENLLDASNQKKFYNWFVTWPVN